MTADNDLPEANAGSARDALLRRAAEYREVATEQLANARKESDGLRSAYEALLEALAETVVRLSATASQRDELSKELAALSKELAVLSKELATLSEAHQTDRNALVAELESWKANNARLEWELNKVYNSTSWRITKPVRYLGTSLQRFSAVLRRIPEATRRRLVRFARNCLNLARFGLNRVIDLLIGLTASWRGRFGTPRTLWGVTPILTLPLLAKCDRLLGLKSDSLVFTTYYTTSAFDINLQRIWQFVYAKYPGWGPRFHRLVFRLALLRYDVFHLFCDRGMLPPTRRMEINPEEMRAIRHYGCRLYTYTYGADVRTREATLELGHYNLCTECPEPGRFCICDDTEGGANIARIREHATAMLAMGDMLAYVPGARDLHFWPIETAKFPDTTIAWSKGRPLRIAHAPNHTHFKGTHYLIAAIERLQAEKYDVELVQVQGVPNTEVIALFRSCDLVADQFIAGFHGYTALEAMALGKPVLCYLRDPSMVIDPDNCPMINAWPDTIYDTLKHCLDGHLDLAALGRRSRAYVHHYYSLEAVAIRLGRLYVETAGFPDRVNRRILKHVDALERRLPGLIPGPLPRGWSSVSGLDRSQAVEGADRRKLAAHAG